MEQNNFKKTGFCKNILKMYFVYIIKSIDFPEKIYTGFSNNIKNRIEAHNQGKSIHTKKFRPWKLVYYCSFTNQEKALAFEKYLKTASGIAFRNKRLL